MDALVYPVVWLLGLMLAPHTLALLGNLAGQLHWLTPVVLAAGVGLYWLNITSLKHLTKTSVEPVSALDALSHEHGGLPAVMLFFCGRFITSIALSTVLLVTAGFVFNETFVYWFPNFAFAFVLLGLVVSVQLLGAAAARRFQLLCIALVLTGMAVLTLMGLMGGSAPDSRASFSLEGIAIRSYLAVTMLFVGFDLAANHDANPGINFTKPMIAGLLIAGITFALWAVVSVQYVPAHKLANTFIAHTLAAKAIGGQLGRMIMGGVIIAGSCAAVNTLFRDQGRSLTRLSSRWKGNSPATQWVRHGAMGSILSGVIVAVMMAAGEAGTDEIDTYVRAGLYFWMLSYAGVHLGVLLRRYREPRIVSTTGLRAALLGGVMMTAISAGLIATDPERALVLKVAGIVLFLIAALSIAHQIRHRRFLVKGNRR